MRSRFPRWTKLALALIISLFASTAVPVPAVAEEVESSVVSAEAENILLTEFVRMTTFPELTECVRGTATRPLPDHVRKMEVAVDCSSPAVLPVAITVPKGYSSLPGTYFVSSVASLARTTSAEATNAISTASGLPPQQIALTRIDTLAVTMLQRHTTVSEIGHGSTVELTNVCGHSGRGMQSCANLTGIQEALFWGGVGAIIGGSRGGAIGAIIGAILGFLFGLL